LRDYRGLRRDLIHDAILVPKASRTVNSGVVQARDSANSTSQPVARTSSPLTVLPGIGPRRAEHFATSFGVQDLGGLLHLLPRRYQLKAEHRTIEQLVDGDRARITGAITKVWMFRPRGRHTVLSVRLEDDSGTVDALFFNQPYLRKSLEIGQVLTLEGKASLSRGRQLLGARRVQAEEGKDTVCLDAIYPEAEGLSSGLVARTIEAAYTWAAQDFGPEEPLPEFMLGLAQVPTYAQALHRLHFPTDLAQVEFARRRLALGEVLRLELARLKLVNQPQLRRTPEIEPQVWQRIFARIPFRLNEDQQQALQEMRADLEAGATLRRLLHGEVGSGKTVIAFALALAIAATGGQVALLAPTEILARQHLATFGKWLQGSRLPIVALLGDDTAAQRRASLAQLASGRACIAIGTHALFGPKVRFRQLDLVVFDEQHRFGVRQKAALVSKGEKPHVLTMTATPIPRTLAWARYGALDACILRSRAGNHANIQTRVQSLDQWPKVAAELAEHFRRGLRAFVVAPRIDGPEGLLALAHELKVGAWRGLPIALVHGRLPGAEVARAVADFQAGRVLALLGTSVVEVGLDVPNVPRMVVLGAQRFGLASLHQLRGRLARGPEAEPGRCDFLADSEALDRLKCLEICQDGFQVADLDLELRGPGVLQGQAQHGHAGFQIFDPASDQDLVDLMSHKEIRNWLADQG
jgi:ATP-dependent DNA helicase RecG